MHIYHLSCKLNYQPINQQMTDSSLHVVLNSAVYMHIHIAMPHLIPIKAMVMFTGQKYEVNPRARPA